MTELVKAPGTPHIEEVGTSSYIGCIFGTLTDRLAIVGTSHTFVGTIDLIVGA